MFSSFEVFGGLRGLRGLCFQDTHFILVIIKVIGVYQNKRKYCIVPDSIILQVRHSCVKIYIYGWTLFACNREVPLNLLYSNRLLGLNFYQATVNSKYLTRSLKLNPIEILEGRCLKGSRRGEQ